MRKFIVLIIKWFIALISVTSMRLIKCYFVNPNDEFKIILRDSGFHMSVVNNPFILYKNKRCVKIPYNSWFAKILLSVFYISVKYKCWIKDTKCFYLLRLFNFQEAYVYNILLAYDKFTFASYKEIKFLFNKSENDVNTIVVYSVIVGDYDEIIDPVYISKNCDYILFTDNPNIRSNIWDIHLLNSTTYDNILRAREVKILTHKFLDKKYEYSIFVDGRTFICGNIKKLVDTLDENISLGFIKHSINHTVKEELEACIQCNLFQNNEFASQQFRKYQDAGFMDNLGLVETGLIVRKHNDDKVKQLMIDWWNEVVKYTQRDQLSVMYVLWKNSYLNYRILDGSVWSNQFSIITNHKLKK